MFDVRQSENELRIRMSARLSHIDSADAAVARFLADRALTVDPFAVRISLREAALNAVIHGCGCDHGKQVALVLRINERGLLLTVGDEGEGFDWRSQDETFDIVGDSGRGLALMRIYSSDMHFNDAGNSVELCWNIPGATAADAPIADAVHGGS